MTVIPIILSEFLVWAKETLPHSNEKVSFGIADQKIENIAWARIETDHTVSGIKIWDTSDFYLEILRLDQEEPVLARFGMIHSGQSFSDAFMDFFICIEKIEASK